jgi:hypothetical protein
MPDRAWDNIANHGQRGCGNSTLIPAFSKMESEEILKTGRATAPDTVIS